MTDRTRVLTRDEMPGKTVEAAGTPTRLRAEDLTIGYDKRVISEHLDVEIPDGGSR